MATRDEYSLLEGLNIDLIATRMQKKNQANKKQKKGAFMNFVKEKSNTWKNEGKDVSTLAKAISVADPEWRKLSAKEKESYRDEGPDMKENVNLTLGTPNEQSEEIPYPPEREDVGSADEGSVINIKQLSIIYEEDEEEQTCEEDKSIESTSHAPNNIGSTNISNIPHSANDCKLKTEAKNFRHCQQQTMKLFQESNNMDSKYLKAGKNGLTMNENFCSRQIICTPDTSADYFDEKSSTPIKTKKGESTKENLDISQIKNEKYNETINSTSSISSSMESEMPDNEKREIKKAKDIIKQAEDLMNDSMW